MCLYAKGSRIKYEIAEEDIVVYKRLLLDNRSPYMKFQYKSNSTITLKKRLVAYARFEISEGLHAYVSRKTAKRECYKGKTYSYCDEKVVKMIIPAGTRYALGTNDEIVSECLVTGRLRNNGG